MSVPNRTEVLDDLYTTTFNNRAKRVVDQIFDASPFYAEMRRRNGIQLDGTGGRFLEVNLSYAKNETITSLGKGDTISISDTKFLTVAQYEWKFVAGSIVRYFTDDAKNKSRQAHINLANSKINNLRDSLTDKFEDYLFGDGTGNSNKDPLGIDALIDTSPTDNVSVGNINQLTYSWWRNRTKAATGAASVYLLSDMRNLANTISESKMRQMPNMIVTTQTVSELYDDEVLEQRQIVNLGVNDPEGARPNNWKGIPVMWSSRCPSGRMYMMRSDNIALKIDPDINFMMTAWKPIPNQVEDRVAQIVVKTELISDRRKSLGVMTGIAA
jgi:hypothetical protein